MSRDQGSACVEVVGLSVVLLLPVVLVVTAVVRVEAASLAVRQAAREGARAVVTSTSLAQARTRVATAARLAFQGQQVSAEPVVTLHRGGCGGPLLTVLRPGQAVTACVSATVELPGLDRVGGHLRVQASQTFTLDPLRPALRG